MLLLLSTSEIAETGVGLRQFGGLVMIESKGSALCRS